MRKNNLIRVSTRQMPHDEWLQMRRRSIGGSDAAAIAGVNPYSSPYSVWAEKTCRLPEKHDSEAMRQGRELEEYVAARWREVTGKKTHRVHAILYNRALPFAHANIDRWVVGENAGLECKTTSALNLKCFQAGEYPERYYAQCLHYLAVTGAERWYLAVLVLNKGLYHFTIERDEEAIKALLKREEEFWSLVQNGTPPPVDGSDATGEALRSLYPGGGDALVLTGRDELFARYADLNAQKAQVDTGLEMIKQQLMADLKDAESATCGDWNVSWKRQTRKCLDTAALQTAYPQLSLEPFYRSSESRVLRISKKQKKG